MIVFCWASKSKWAGFYLYCTPCEKTVMLCFRAQVYDNNICDLPSTQFAIPCKLYSRLYHLSCSLHYWYATMSSNDVTLTFCDCAYLVSEKSP